MTADRAKEPYHPANKVRFVTAASLFDGHDASINIIRRMLQAGGAEVIHLGHNRSVAEIVDAAVQEDVQAIAVSSYQGGHLEFFKYMVDLLKERRASHILVFGGGGGVIIPEEIEELEAYGVAKIFSPEDGRSLGLQGMINQMLEACDFPLATEPAKWFDNALERDPQAVARLLTCLEDSDDPDRQLFGDTVRSWIEEQQPGVVPVVGITGTGGSGKSSLTDELVRRFLADFSGTSVAILSVDPSKRRTGGALLGDRIRMNSVSTSMPLGNPRLYMRSLATRTANSSISHSLGDAVKVAKAAGFDLVILETAGIGQSDAEVVELVDVAVYVMTSEYGASTQLEKIQMLDFADLVVLNKFEKRGSQDALRDVRKQYRRNHLLWETPDEQLPVYPTIASQFNDPGTNRFYSRMVAAVAEKTGVDWSTAAVEYDADPQKVTIIPPDRQPYLSEITQNNREQRRWIEEQAEIARQLYQLDGAHRVLAAHEGEKELKISSEDGQGSVEIRRRTVSPDALQAIEGEMAELEKRLAPQCRELLDNWPKAVEAYRQEKMVTRVRDREIVTELFSTSLSGLKIPKVALPRYRDWGDILGWILLENLPGAYPFTAGAFPFRRVGETPTRMFAGEGTPERTNHRFHYLATGQPATRLSTAFDSVTLYGEDPDEQPDVYGKVGNSGVSICTLDDAKKLYCGFDLCAANTSVSMTINGPGPMILAMFFNTAIDQQVELHLRRTGGWEEAHKTIARRFADLDIPRPVYRGQDRPEGDRALGLGTLGISGDQLLDAETYGRIREATVKVVRGTVQADILKEDQAQNTCIFSTEFALRMMGDIQQYFIDHSVRNYYSVSISGYHIAEAGANPISQLAFTLSNGFTYVEYYLSRGMEIDKFAHNLSFFFSNGIDPEYAVIGRVARRIWSTAMKHKYGAGSRSQKLKYHIQTSGRSLHAQEIDFNDIRTTLQALYAHYDNCNSLHTNSYDEAITTPTEESVRRAVAIQMIIDQELGLAKNQNPIQGAFIIEELTDLVEQAVLEEFDRISRRGGVLGAMETQYQRGKIQEESMYYEHLKHSGELPIMGVNTFLRPANLAQGEAQPTELIRSTPAEKEQQLNTVIAFRDVNAAHGDDALIRLRTTAREKGNLFAELMETVKYCSLGQISHSLFGVGGRFRRNM
jgi:methylmalonyl-CoA mutase